MRVGEINGGTRWLGKFTDVVADNSDAGAETMENRFQRGRVKVAVRRTVSVVGGIHGLQLSHLESSLYFH
jgi:hypothetical protein